MGYCEDFPCCGHELGCCPDYDEHGNQINMICTCGAKLPVNREFSLCDSCLFPPEEDEDFEEDELLDDEFWSEGDVL